MFLQPARIITHVTAGFIRPLSPPGYANDVQHLITPIKGGDTSDTRGCSWRSTRDILDPRNIITVCFNEENLKRGENDQHYVVHKKKAT